MSEARDNIIRSTKHEGKQNKTVKDPWKMTDPEFDEAKLKEKYGQHYYENREQATQTIAKYWMRFRKSEMETTNQHKKWAVIDQFDRGEQWKDHNIPPWVPKPITNFIKFVRTTKRANMSASIPKPTFMPLHWDDVDMVRMLQLAHDHVWETERIARTVRRCYDRALLYGTSIAYVYEDDQYVGGKYYGKGDPKNMLFQGQIKVRRYPIQNFFPDPDAYRIDDCKYIDTTEIIALRDVKNNPAFIKYCEAMGWLHKLNELNYTQLDFESDASGTIFDRDVTPLDTPKNVEGDEIVTLHTHWERYFKDGEWHLDVTYWMRNIDFFLLRVEDVQPNCYPFAVLYDEEEENEIWGTSTAMDILENQKIMNKLEQTAAILGVMHQNPQKVVWRESGINGKELARTGTLPGKVWESNIDPTKAISIVQPLPIPKELFDLDDRTQANIRDMVGINEAQQGKAPGSVTTSTGVNDLIETGSTRDRDKMIQIDDFVEQLSNIVMSFILYKWKERRPIAIMGPKGSPEFGIYEPIKDDITLKNLKWHVRSDIYAKAPTTQAQRRQQANQMMNYQAQFQVQPAVITPEEFVRMCELDDQEEILQRMSRERQQMQQAQSSNIAQQIMQVAQQIHSMKNQGASDQNAMQAAQQLAQQLVTQQQNTAMRNGQVPEGVISGNQSTPASQGQSQQGTMGAVQAANMAKG